MLQNHSPQAGNYVSFRDNENIHYHVYFCHEEWAPNTTTVCMKKNELISIIISDQLRAFHNSIHSSDTRAECAKSVTPRLSKLALNYAYQINVCTKNNTLGGLPFAKVVWPSGTSRSRGAEFFASSRHAIPQKSNRPFLRLVRHIRQAKSGSVPSSEDEEEKIFDCLMVDFGDSVFGRLFCGLAICIGEVVLAYVGNWAESGV